MEIEFLNSRRDPTARIRAIVRRSASRERRVIVADQTDGPAAAVRPPHIEQCAQRGRLDSAADNPREVTVRGQHLTPRPFVYFGGSRADVLFAAPTELVFLAPGGVNKGRVVVVTQAGAAASRDELQLEER